MGLILDTSVLVLAERRRFDLAAFTDAQRSNPTAIAAITASELLHGRERERDPAVRARRTRFLDRLLASVPVLPFTLGTAHIHARIWATLAARGTMIGYHDLLIAATALEGDHAVATLNTREFARVPEIRLADVAPYVVTA